MEVLLVDLLGESEVRLLVELLVVQLVGLSITWETQLQAMALLMVWV